MVRPQSVGGMCRGYAGQFSLGACFSKGGEADRDHSQCDACFPTEEELVRCVCDEHYFPAFVVFA